MVVNRTGREFFIWRAKFFAIREAGDAVKGAVDSAEEWVVNRVAEMMLDFASQGETQANLVLTYIIVGENVYVCTESMKDAFLDRPSRLKIQAERMDLVQSYHIGRYGARVCQVAAGIGEQHWEYGPC